MTYQPNCTLPEEILEQIAAEGLEALPELIRVLINEAMRLEREQHLGAGPYERSPERKGYANGYKPKTVKTRVGEIQFDVPQVRQGDFYPDALEKGLRSERALTLALAELYVQGDSTRRVAAITEQLCGTAVNSMQVSRASEKMDEILEAWRTRPLGKIVYLYLDARYEKVRMDGQIRDAAILIASGVGPDGRRRILGVSVSLSEAEQHWRLFLEELIDRGLEEVQLIISDDHHGLRKARQAVFTGVPWQRCQIHLQQNASQYVPRKRMQAEVAADIRAVFNAPNRAHAKQYLKQIVNKYAEVASDLADWMEGAIPEGLTVFDFPEAHRRRIRTSNMLERVNQEIKRRTRVVRIFPNQSSCLRLVSAILMEIDEDWETGRIYLNIESD
ncbi:MAG: IS256 family transposase [Anaerolineaceae bacterium]|nr:IS256 family transposase [Anaerolineaceae bacterium]